MAAGYRKLLAAGRGGDSVVKSSLDAIEAAQAGHRDVMVKIREKNEELYSLVSVEPVDAGELRRLLDTNTTLFSYYVAEKTLYIWAVNRDRVHLERIKITREEVTRLVSSFNRAIAAKNKKQAEALSEKVYDTFLKPVIPFVAGGRIGFGPPGALYYLPFAAMSYKRQYLVDGFSIFYLPGAGVLKYVLQKQPSAGTTVAAFGNPDLGDRQFDLPYAEMEVENIKKIIPGAEVYLRAAATKEKAVYALDNYDLAHFAVHGFFVEEAPMNPGPPPAISRPEFIGASSTKNPWTAKCARS
jgi:CHAT domain-containing protein